MKLFKIAIYTPLSHADKIREVIAENGAGQIGDYDWCSFSVRGQGRFRPSDQTQPFIGKKNVISTVAEEKIETVCEEDKLPQILNKLLAVHPYEEPAIDVWEIIDYKKFQKS